MKVNTPKGTRDFLPDVVRRRNYIFETIRAVFEKYGYQPIETPALENSDTLAGKYGDEGDRLIFALFDSGFPETSIYNEVFPEDPILDSINSLLGFSPTVHRLTQVASFFAEGLNLFIKNDPNLEEFTLKGYYDFSRNHFSSHKESLYKSLYTGRFEPTSPEVRARLNYLKSAYLISESVFARSLREDDYLSQLTIVGNIDESISFSENSKRLFFTRAESLNEKDSPLRQALETALYVLKEFNPGSLKRKLTSKALRYDLTVPFARFVVQHQNDLSFPFRRYQIQPVWRADRPQKGRYREFYQCDADVVGTDSLRCEVEYCRIFDEVFSKLGLPVEIRLNNRKLLASLAEYIGEKDRLVPMTIAIDKLDKMPMEAVLEDLRKQDFSEAAIEKLKGFLEIAAEKLPNADLLDRVAELLGESPDGQKGIEELRFILEKIDDLGMESAKIVLDLSLARGLNYYTGAIFEVRPLTESQVGSICGGGRYDDLTGIFGMKGMSGVGISFGADRIYDLLEAENAFPDKETEGTKLLFVNFGESEADWCDRALVKIRKAGIRAELYPDGAKMKKQMKYANDKQIPFVALVGENEMKSGHITLKDMESGEQFALDVDELIKKLS